MSFSRQHVMGRTSVVWAPKPTADLVNRRGRFNPPPPLPLPSSLLARRSCNLASATLTKERVCFVHGVIASFAIQTYSNSRAPRPKPLEQTFRLVRREPLTTAGMDAPKPLGLPTWKLKRSQRRQAEAVEQSCLQHPHKAAKLELRPAPVTVFNPPEVRLRAAGSVGARSQTRNSSLKSSRRTSWW